MDVLYDAIGDHALYIEDFIEDMKKVFPTLGNDWGIYMPEVKYLSPEPLVNYKDLSLTKYPNVHFVGMLYQQEVLQLVEHKRFIPLKVF